MTSSKRIGQEKEVRLWGKQVPGCASAVSMKVQEFKLPLGPPCKWWIHWWTGLASFKMKNTDGLVATVSSKSSSGCGLTAGSKVYRWDNLSVTPQIHCISLNKLVSDSIMAISTTVSNLDIKNRNHAPHQYFLEYFMSHLEPSHKWKEAIFQNGRRSYFSFMY